ncbi:MAG TPA: hypothetical protein VK915_11680 [Gaiellaceae bacterium]|nr:hypothetical protein [Gaiellaceae bacterium]
MVVIGILTISPTAGAVPPAVKQATKTFDYTKNMHPLGYSAKLFPNNPNFDGWNSDLAFWGKTAYQGTINGFRILNVKAPAKPREIVDYTDCAGDQGDVIVWKNILVRSWNSPAPAGATCGGLPVPQGQEGLHVFDVSNPKSPQVLTFVPLDCGSHTATGVPDKANNRLLVYNGNSGAACPFIDIVEVPLDNPGDAAMINRVDAMHTCHDIGVILGKVNKAACAGGEGVRVFGIGGSSGGSLDDPELLFHVEIPGVTIGHSAAWSWDGKTIVFGHEPGGGILAQCQATTPEVNKTLFFLDGSTGAIVGSLIFPRPQTALENCTWHNYNVVPTKKRNILVSGNYQAGISVVDFTNPAKAFEFAYADPAPLPCCTTAFGLPLTLGGDWSSYWYNGFIYQSDITRGLLIWKLSDKRVAGAKKLSHLNPQTQEFSIK